MKKVLIITYYWPPAGGPGVQRILKFTKYLPQFGWKPIILTVENGTYPAFDNSLKIDIPQEAVIYKSRSIEPDNIYRFFTGREQTHTPVGVLAVDEKEWKKIFLKWIRLNIFIPDAKLLWKYSGFKCGKKIISIEKPDIIFSTSPPPTTHRIAQKLAKWSGVPWVADFRDPWTKIHYYSFSRFKISRKIDQLMERSVLQSCDLVTCASRNFIDLLELKDKTKAKVIYNGFDKSDFSEDKKASSLFKIVYVGGLNTNRYYPEFFVKLNQVLLNKSLDPKKVRLIIAGSVTQEIEEDIRHRLKPFTQLIDFNGYLSHSQAIKLMQNASLLLLFMEKTAKYEGHVPGKLFEYLAAKRPVLGIGPPSGDSANILSDLNAGHIFHPQQDISDELVGRYSNWLNRTQIKMDTEKLNKYTRKKLTQTLAKYFDELI